MHDPFAEAKQTRTANVLNKSTGESSLTIFKAGLEFGLGPSALDLEGRRIWIVDAHGYGKRFIVRADEILTAFLELERAVCVHLLTERGLAQERLMRRRLPKQTFVADGKCLGCNRGRKAACGFTSSRRI
jgi:hypothetical protein